MAISIDQRPQFTVLPIGQKVIFAVSENTVVANQTRVKFIANVYVDWNKTALGSAQCTEYEEEAAEIDDTPPTPQI